MRTRPVLVRDELGVAVSGGQVPGRLSSRRDRKLRIDDPLMDSADGVRPAHDSPTSNGSGVADAAAILDHHHAHPSAMADREQTNTTTMYEPATDDRAVRS
jgi:hypothetical protein